MIKSLPRDIVARAAAAGVGLFFVRDGIYALQGKAMRIWLRRLTVQKVSGPVETRVYGLVFMLMAAFMFLLSWHGFD